MRLIHSMSRSIFIVSDLPPPLPNIGYLGSSYNIIIGNPLATGRLDPGFLSATGIFKFTYDQGLTTADGRYSIPDHTNVNAIESCSFAFSSTTTREERSYMDSLKVKVDTSFSGWGASFSQSSEYQEVKEYTSNSEALFISSSAECQVYGGSIDNAQFIDDFEKEVHALPSDLSLADYKRFIARWGTHISTSLVMGGRFGYNSRFETSKYGEMMSKGFNFKAAAGYSGAFSIDSSLTTEEEMEKAEEYNNAREDRSIFQVGGKPVVGDDGSAFLWAETVREDPLPLIYGLTELYNFLDAHNFPEDADINAKRENLREANVAYCEDIAPEPDLCEIQFGPNPGPRIGVRLGSILMFCSGFFGFFCQHSQDPKMRAMGALAAVRQFDHIPSPVVMVDSRMAPPELITEATGVLVSPTRLYMRYRCPAGYISVSDFEHTDPVFRQPALPCIAKHCLKQCSKGDEGGFERCHIIEGGSIELGSGNNYFEDFSFFRSVAIDDPDHTEAELFQCLTYRCLKML